MATGRPVMSSIAPLFSKPTSSITPTQNKQKTTSIDAMTPPAGKEQYIDKVKIVHTGRWVEPEVSKIIIVRKLDYMMGEFTRSIPCTFTK